MSSKHVVVIGGGSAGAYLVRELSAKLASTQHAITLITDKEYYPHYLACLRTLSGPVGDTEWPESTFLSLDHLFKPGNGKGKIVFGKAISIEYDSEGKTGSGKVRTDKDEIVPFDVLAVATGSTWEGPLSFGPTKKEALQHVVEWREKIKDAKGIAIVGGGAVGIELAGEIRDLYPTKPITLIHNQSLLLNPRYPDKFRRDLARRLAKRNIHLVLDDSINVDTANEGHSTTEGIVTAKGFSVDADLMIPTRGPRINPALLETLNPKPITPAGHADVDATLQLKNHPNIFALGDIISWDGEIPQKIKHGRQIPLVCKNICEVLAGRQPTAKYSAGVEGIFITIGKTSGAGYMGVLWGLTFGDRLVSMLKGKALFAPPVKKALGY